MTINEYIFQIQTMLWRRVGRAEHEALFTSLSVEEDQINTGYILGLKEAINVLEDTKNYLNEKE